MLDLSLSSKGKKRGAKGRNKGLPQGENLGMKKAANEMIPLEDQESGVSGNASGESFTGKYATF